MRHSLFQKINYKLFIALAMLACGFFPSQLFAATLSLTPSSATVSVGNITTLKVSVGTSGKYINNAEGSIQFPTDLLEVVSLSKSSSVFSLWVEEPSYSNNTGKIVFNGGVANPGFNGSNGSIVSVTFKAKKTGTASIIFTDGAVRENDGLGTDILTAKNGSTLTIGNPEIVDVPQAPISPDVPNTTGDLPKPVIVSETHPDQNRWYSGTAATFSWKIPVGVTGVQTLFNKNSSSIPTVAYDNSVTQKTISAISDGIYYLHVRYVNAKSTSSVAHYSVKIDSTPPKSFAPSVNVESYKNSITLDAQDVTSGISHYTIQIDNAPVIRVLKENLVEEKYDLPYQLEGNHSVIVVAYDNAGNQTKATTVFSSPAISVPTLSLSAEKIARGEVVTIFGETNYPNSQIEISLSIDGKEFKKYSQTTLSDGSFSFVTDKLKSTGIVTIVARSVLGERVQSAYSEKVFLKISATQFAKITLALAGFVVIIILLLLLLIILYIGWHKFFGLKRKINRELARAVKDIHETAVSFKDELSGQLDSLEKMKEGRVFSKKEEAIFNKIKKNIDDIDDFIEKKLKKLM